MNQAFIDHNRYSSKNSSIQIIRDYLFNPGFRFISLYRTCNAYSKYNPIGFGARWWYKRMQRRFGFQIPHRASIGPGFFLGHFGGIVINQGAVIGSNCNVAQGVTVGYVSRGEKKGCPTLGDRVWVGANAVIVGKINIGNDVLIASLTFVNFDIPDMAVVAGNPAKIISYKGSAGYIKNLV
jgi:serine O-acetyltransferase